jgi:GNAT superfamily N-acetyltransferase
MAMLSQGPVSGSGIDDGGRSGHPAAVEIRTPLRSELRACRLMLPSSFRRGVAPELLVAVGMQPFRFLGALAYGLVLFEGKPAWRLRLHVVSAHRRLGIGTRLLGSLASRGSERGVSTLIAQREAEEESGAAPFLESAGFRYGFRSSMYEGDLEHYRAAVGPLRERLAGRGRIPSDARSVSLDEAPREALSRLLADHARRTPHSIGTPWADAWRRPQIRDASSVLMRERDVIGVILAEKHDECAEVIWRVVAPSYRGGWANVVLNAATWDHMFQNGVRRVRFATTVQTPDTERFVRIYGAGQARHTDYFVRALPPAVGRSS